MDQTQIPATPKPKRPKPIESFGAELMAVLLKGSLQEVRLNMPYKKAIKMRQRIYQLRNVMRQTNHSQYSIAARARVTILWGRAAGLPQNEPDLYNAKNVPRPADRTCDAILVIAPHDSEFSDALAQAGISVNPPQLDGAPSPGNDILEAWTKKP